MSSKQVTDHTKWKKWAAVLKCTGGLTSGLFLHLKRKDSLKELSQTQLDVFSNTPSVSYLKHLKSACSQLTLHSCENKKIRKEMVAKLVAVDGFLPVPFVKVNLSVRASVIKGCFFQKILIMSCNWHINIMKMQRCCYDENGTIFEEV